MPELTVITDSPLGTETLGRLAAGVLLPGDLLALEGNLGAGKTRLSQAIAAGLGVDREQVSSPTFVLIHEYDGRLPVFHMDCYRLADIDEFLELGAEEFLGGEGVCLVEWADRVADALPRDRLTIRITAPSESTREFRFLPGGRRSAALVESLRIAVAASPLNPL